MDITPAQVEAGHAFYTKRTLGDLRPRHPRLLLPLGMALPGEASPRALRPPRHREPPRRRRRHRLLPRPLPVPGTPTPGSALLDASTAVPRQGRPPPRSLRPRDPPRRTSSNRSRSPPPRSTQSSLNYVLHCLPGTIRTKAIALSHLKALTNPGAVIFGATLLHDGVPQELARAPGHGPQQPARRLLQHGTTTSTGSAERWPSTCRTQWSTSSAASAYSQDGPEPGPGGARCLPDVSRKDRPADAVGPWTSHFPRCVRHGP